MSGPLVDLDRSADEAQALLDEAIAADAHPGRGTGGWINFLRGWLSIRQQRRWSAAEGHMAARYRTEWQAIQQLVDDFQALYATLDQVLPDLRAGTRLQRLDVARLRILLDEP